MKLNPFLLAFVILTSCSQEEQKNIFINGNFKNAISQNLYLYEYGANTPKKVDSCTTDAEGNFTIEHQDSSYKFYGIGSNYAQSLGLILKGDEKITLSGDLENLFQTAIINGSEGSAAYLDFYRKKSDYVAYQQEVEKKARELNPDEISENHPLIQEARKKQQEFQALARNFVESNHGTPAIYAALSDLRNPETDLELVNKIRTTVKRTMPESIFAVNADQHFQQLKSTAEAIEQQKKQTEAMALQREAAGLSVGAEAPELNFPNPEGKLISLHGLRGKIVLLDFWASWCKPCRMENPNVVKLYQKYKDKGFSVYSYSLDKDKAPWLNAIKQDGLVWPNHVSDLKGWSGQGASLYMVTGIPQTYLIGKDGKIIASGLRGPELEQKLTELLGK